MQILHQTKMLDAQKSEYLQKHAVFCVIFCNCVYNSKSYFCILLVKFPFLPLIICIQPYYLGFAYLGGARPSCADVTSPKHLLIAQDATFGVLLVVQELLEGFESILAVRGASDLL